MARILITSGPTRQYLDPVRYLTNGSSGRMGAALAQAALDTGHEVTIVSGPVQIEYPAAAQVISIVSTEELLDACCAAFPACDGAIGAAAPCDYRPHRSSTQKIAKTGQPLALRAGRNAGRHRHLGGDEAAGAMAGRFRLGNARSAYPSAGETGKEELRPDGPQRPRRDGFATQPGRNHRSSRTHARCPSRAPRKKWPAGSCTLSKPP